MANEKIVQINECSRLLENLIKETKQTADIVGRGDGGREVSLAITNLQQAEHWLQDAAKLVK